MIFTKANNIDPVIIKFLKYFEVTINPLKIAADLDSHPDYPSLLSVSDVGADQEKTNDVPKSFASRLTTLWPFSIILFNLLFYCLNSYGQKADISLHKTLGQVPSFSLRIPAKDEDSSHLEIPKSINLDHYNYYYINMGPLTTLFRQYKSGEIDYKTYSLKAKFITQDPIDTLQLEERIHKFPASQDKIHCISGVNKTGDKIIMIDADHNGVISQNEIIVFSAATAKEVKDDISVADRFQNLQLRQKAIDGSISGFNVKIIPFGALGRKSDPSQRLTTDFILLRNELWSGKISLNKHQLAFYAFSKTPVNELNKLQFKISYDDIVDKGTYDLKDEWNNEKISISLDSLSEATDHSFNLSIVYQSPPGKLRDTTFTMQIKNVKKNGFESLGAFLHQKKYILIDYWGTWCIPCIEKIPDLKKMQLDFPDKFTLISIAYDYNINTVNDFDKLHGNNGNSYFIDRNDQHSILKPLKVLSFPTYRLYDTEGKLIFNSQAEPDKDLAKIREILSK